MNGWKRVGLMMAALLAVAGCSRPVLKEHALPSRTKDEYLRIKRVALLPFENYSDPKDADKTIDALLIPALRDEGIFDEVEDTRFVRDVMKKLKITATDVLDKEVLKKLGDEMNLQGIIYGKILSYGKGKEKEAASQVTMDMALVEPSTGKVLWVGNVSAYGGLTVGKVFGVTEGKTDIEVARDAVRRLADSLASEVERARERERKGIAAEIRKEEEIERAKLEKLKSETGRIQERIDKAKKEAQGIRDAAAKEAEAARSELELQKAALEAEKGKAQAAQQAAEQEKLKVELERKKIEEDLKKIAEEKKTLEEAKKKAAEAIKEEPVKETAPQAPAPAPPPPSPGPSSAPAPAPSPAGAAPATR
ncbi:MAG: hypothetical protein M1550_03685 [Deltaproteobacteria bacterium]|nr:hypothetical protein [Deltaproteobacteria bacterium]